MRGVGGLGVCQPPTRSAKRELSTCQNPSTPKIRKRGETISNKDEIPKSIHEKKQERERVNAIRRTRDITRVPEFQKIADRIDQMHKSKDHASAYSFKIKDFQNGKIAITTYDIPQMVGFKRNHTPERGENRMTANEQNAQRARRKVFELVNANLTPYTKFVTLTYAENMQDYDRLGIHFKSFIRHLKRKGYQFPYLWVVEKQKRGALHVHALFFTDEFIPHQVLAEAWKHGYVKINAKFDEVDHKGAYVAKYIQKETLPPDKKAYRASRDIKKPTTRVGLGGLNDAIRVARLNGYVKTSDFTYSIPTKDTLVKWKTGEVVPAHEDAGATVHTFEKQKGEDEKWIEKLKKGSGNMR